MRYLTLLISFFYIQIAFATNPEIKGTTLSGKVLSSADNKGVEFATISLHKQQDSSLVSGTIASTGGVFSIEEIAEGTYYLRVGFIGFKTKTITGIVVGKGNKAIDLGTITIAPNVEQLKEVEITSEARVFETQIDKKVFNVEKSGADIGGTGLDALRQVPSVEVDTEDNIQLRGQSNVRIFIDGRPSAIPANQLLKQLPASSIEKIELVTNPSAKYDPEGMSGIINVILKKENNSGFNGSVNLSTGKWDNWRNNLSTNFNYRKNKLNLTANVGGSKGGFDYSGLSKRTYSVGGNNFEQLSDEDNTSKNQGLFGKLGADYFLNDKTTLYVSGGLNVNEGERLGSNVFNTTNEGVSTVQSRLEINNTSQSPSFSLNGGIQKKFNTDKHTLDIDLNYSSNNNLNDNFYTTYYPDGSQPTNYLYQAPNENGANFISKVDYVLPINDSTTFEAGFHTTIENQTSEQFIAKNLNNGSGAYSSIDSVNNILDYSQNVFALYTTFGKQYKKIGVKAGLRAEQTYTDANLRKDNNTPFNNDYFKFFPSLHLSYKQNQTTEYQISYSRRINRPNTWQINPFADLSNPFTQFRGNPTLLPELVNVYELSFIKYLQKFSVNASIYYQDLNNQIRRFLDTDTNGISIVTYKNYAGAELYGAETTIGFTPKKSWRLNLTGNYWYSVTQKGDAGLGQNANYSNFGYSASLSSNITLPKGWMLMQNIRYNGAMQVLQGTIKPRGALDLSARKNILKDKGTIGIRVADVLFTRQFQFNSDNTADNYTLENNRRWESRFVYLSFSYNFGKQIKGEQRRRSRGNNSSDDSFSAPDMQ